MVKQPYNTPPIKGGRYMPIPPPGVQWLPIPPFYQGYIDPNHHPWVHPYGNAPPMLNGGRPQGDTENPEHDSNVEDERSPGVGSAYVSPPGVALPVSTGMQQPIYPMMYPNMYLGNMPGYMNPPVYPSHMYNIPVNGGDPNPAAAVINGIARGGGGGSRVGSSSSNKVTVASKGTSVGEKGIASNDSMSVTSGHVSGLSDNASNEPVQVTQTNVPPHTMSAASTPLHPHTSNYVQMHMPAYPYYYHPQAAPPPSHLPTAQHAATGSPIYMQSLPSMQIFPPLYNTSTGVTGAAPIYSNTVADNGGIGITPPPPALAAAAAAHSHPTLTNTTITPAVTSTTIDTSVAAACINEMPFKTAAAVSTTTTTLLAADAPVFEHQEKKMLVTTTNGDSELPPENDQSNECIIESSDTSAVIEDKVEPPISDKVIIESPDEDANSVVDEPSQSVNLNTDSNENLINSLKLEATTSECEFSTVDAIEVEKSITNSVSEIDISTTTAEANTEIVDSGNSSSCTSLIEDFSQSATNIPETCTNIITHACPVVEPAAAPPSVKVNTESVSNTPEDTRKTWASLFKESSNGTKTNASIVNASQRNLSVDAPISITNSDGVSSDNTSSNFVSANTSGSLDAPNASSTYNNQNRNTSVPTIHNKNTPLPSDDAALMKLGELLKNYKLDHKSVNFEPRGLENPSNYCYVNSILQALLACPPFYNLMKCISHNRHSWKNKSKHYFPIIDSMIQVVDEFKPVPQKFRQGRDKNRKLDAFSTPDITPGKPFEPSSMLSVIRGSSQLKEGQQEDAQEFLTCLLSDLDDEMDMLIKLAGGVNRKSQQNVTSITKVPSVQQITKNTATNNTSNNPLSNGDIGSVVSVNQVADDNDAEWTQVNSKAKSSVVRLNNIPTNRTPLSEIFRGQTRSKVQKHGDSATQTIETFLTLHLNIERVNSVRDAFDNLFGSSSLEGVTSSKTNLEVDAWQHQTLEELPYVLLLHLKYFDYKNNTLHKILKATEFPIDLKLDAKLIANQRSKINGIIKSRQYKLFAVVYHDGKDAMKGHYLTDVYHIGYGGWIRYDDSRVTSVAENDVLKPQLPRVPYLLFYRRCDTIAALMQPPFDKRYQARS